MKSSILAGNLQIVYLLEQHLLKHCEEGVWDHLYLSLLSRAVFIRAASQSMISYHWAKKNEEESWANSYWPLE